MGAPRGELPSGVALLAKEIGVTAALDLAFWRWWRRVVATPADRPLPRAVAVYIPQRLPGPEHRLVRDAGEEAARKLVAAFPGSTVDCAMASWLAEHALINRALEEIALEVTHGASPNEAAARAAVRYKWKDRTAWLKLYGEPKRWSPLSRLPWYVEHELRGLMDPTTRRLVRPR
jgi:hypothetical protein